MADFCELWPGGPRFAQAEHFKLGTDCVLLADFVNTASARRGIDLGCASGAISLLLLTRSPRLHMTGLELVPEAVELARANMAENALTERHGRTPSDAARAAARGETSCTLDDICAAAQWLLRTGGGFSLVHRPERLGEVFACMGAHGMEPKRLRCVQPRAESAPSLVLVEGRRGGKPGLRIEPPLILSSPDGGESDEYRRIYHRV